MMMMILFHTKLISLMLRHAVTTSADSSLE